MTWLLGLSSLILAYFSFPNKFAHFGLLAWFCFVPLLIALLRTKSLKGSFFIAWGFFQIFFLSLLWMNPFQYPERFTSLWIPLTLVAFFIVYPVLFAGLFTLACWFYDLKPAASPISFGLIWIGSEFLLSIIPFGFPISFALTQFDVPPIVRISNITRIYGISFLLIAVNALIALAILKIYTPKILLMIGIVASASVIGINMIPNASEQTKNISVILIQPDLDYRKAWLSAIKPALFSQTLAQLTNLSLQATKNQPNAVIVWPEIAMSGFSLKSPLVRESLKTFLSDGSELIVGAKEDGENRVLVIDHNLEVKGRYSKSKRVPAFESHEVTSEPFSHPIQIGDMKLGLQICWESIFPSISRRLTKEGADILGVVSFNSWLGNTNWPILHMAYTPFRAAENRREMFFINNNGPSVVVDRFGRIREFLPLGKQGFIQTRLFASAGEETIGSKN